MKLIKSKLMATCALLTMLIAPSSHAILVDTKLALVIDVSGSVSTTDYTLQMEGYEAAFNNATVQANIDSLSVGIAVEVFFFSNSAVSAGVGALLTSAADSATFASVIGSLVRPFSGGTSPYNGMNLASSWLLDDTLWDSNNLVMDVSGDGEGIAAYDDDARDYAQASGIMINALAIDDPGWFEDECSVGGYYAEHIITDDGTCYQATGFDDFERAVIGKITAETAVPDPDPVPAPSALALLGLALVSMRIRRKFA